jgi:DNA modification methylase
MNAADKSTVVHPAKFSSVIIEEIRQVLAGHLPEGGLILDPFAGVGGIHLLASDMYRTVGVEIEAPWANTHPVTIQGDALALPFHNDSFDCVVTSPVYGNRFSDHHKARNGSLRRSYTHDLQRMTGDPERTLHPNNSGTLQWGNDYRDSHERAWSEVRRVLKPGGTFILNTSDHIRNGEVQPVTDWHLSTVVGLGFEVIDRIEVPTPRMRNGANSAARVDQETVACLRS